MAEIMGAAFALGAVIGILVGFIYCLIVAGPALIEMLIDIIALPIYIIKTCIDGFKEGWNRHDKENKENEKETAPDIEEPKRNSEEQKEDSERFQAQSTADESSSPKQHYNSEPLDKAGCFGCLFVIITVIGSFALGFSIGEGFVSSLLTGAALAVGDIIAMVLIYGVFSAVDGIFK